MNRQKGIDQVRAAAETWDFIIIGGGATGLGTAVDAVARGYRTLLVERDDFAKGTSSRSTKLLHGGVRYLKQGNISLVYDALRERSLACRNAPHLAGELGFVIPAYSWREKAFYGIGMEVYDRMSGKLSLGRSRWLSREETFKRLPTLRDNGVRGGILYYDGQFDDARLAVNLAQTAVEKEATLLNYTESVGLIVDNKKVTGVRLRDRESGEEFEARAKCVINATGVFCDAVRAMEDPAASPMLVASQGSHLILPREFLSGTEALMVPKTADGRVLFALPWHDKVVVGTTDLPVETISSEPRPLSEEYEFLMEHSAKYLNKAPTPADVLSIFSGLRPLVSPGAGKKTAAISRDHTILISDGGMVTVTGGKWTTYRKMAEDVVNKAAETAGLEKRACPTRELRLHGWTDKKPEANGKIPHVYGSDAPALAGLAREMPEGGDRLHPRLNTLKAEVVWAARHEMARTVEDVLARRTRALLLDARASIEAATETARLLGDELGRDQKWQEDQIRQYRELAAGYLPEAIAQS